MSKLLMSLMFVVWVASGCSSPEPAIRLDEARSQPATTSSEVPASTSTAVESTTTSADATTSTAASPVAEGVELTWATEGTVEADIERAFWAANLAHRQVYAQVPLDPDWVPFTSSHTGEELLRVQGDIVRWQEEGKTIRFPMPSETDIEFIALVTDQEALVQVCEFDRGAIYENDLLWDDTDVDSNFQARFVLIDGEWLWTETIKLRFELLAEGGVPLCMATATS